MLNSELTADLREAETCNFRWQRHHVMSTASHCGNKLNGTDSQLALPRLSSQTTNSLHKKLKNIIEIKQVDSTVKKKWLSILT